MVAMTAKSSTYVIVCLTILVMGFCQDCIDYGHKCWDTEQCCGGCCVDVCIDTYRPCYALTNPCRDHICPPGTMCTVFKPENCPECDIQAVCQ